MISLLENHLSWRYSQTSFLTSIICIWSIRSQNFNTEYVIKKLKMKQDKNLTTIQPICLSINSLTAGSPWLCLHTPQWLCLTNPLAQKTRECSDPQIHQNMSEVLLVKYFLDPYSFNVSLFLLSQECPLNIEYQSWHRLQLYLYWQFPSKLVWKFSLRRLNNHVFLTCVWGMNWHPAIPTSRGV